MLDTGGHRNRVSLLRVLIPDGMATVSGSWRCPGQTLTRAHGIRENTANFHRLDKGQNSISMEPFHRFRVSRRDVQNSYETSSGQKRPLSSQGLDFIAHFLKSPGIGCQAALSKTGLVDFGSSIDICLPIANQAINELGKFASGCENGNRSAFASGDAAVVGAERCFRIAQTCCGHAQCIAHPCGGDSPELAGDLFPCADRDIGR